MKIRPFIAIEGMDGVGKNTTTQYLKSHISGLITNNQFKDPAINKVVTMSAPDYSTETGKKIKAELSLRKPHICELITLFADNRAEQSNEIFEKLHDGSVVICDRWTMSMLVYAAQQMSITTADKIIYSYETHLNAVPIPSLYIVLTASANACRQRLLERYKGDQAQLDAHEKDLELQEKVRSIYTAFCSSEHSSNLRTLGVAHIVHIDAEDSLQNTLTKVTKVVNDWLKTNNFL